jgi:diacylglycerol O-acyltransferase
MGRQSAAAVAGVFRPRPLIERAGPMDLTVMVADHGSVPTNVGSIMIFEGAQPTLAEIRAVLHERVPQIPRLRQTLRRTRFGCGNPVWVDDATFSLDRHLQPLQWPEPGSDRALFDTATDLLCRPLGRDRPMWRAYLVSSPQRAALIVIIHHVLADGLGGLAILAALTDERVDRPGRAFPLRAPTSWELAADAAGHRLRGIRSLPRALRRGRAGLRELGFGRQRQHLAERLSLLRPTSHRRRLAQVAVALDEVVATGHRHGGTVNDVVLAAITGALSDMLNTRGEHPGRLVVSVPVSGRSAADARTLGNNTGVRPLSVPAVADDATRLTAIIAATGPARRSSDRAASAAPLGWAFRMLYRTGLFQLFIDHQRLVHTFETNVRGPARHVHLAGHRVSALVPLVATPGNVGVTFAALSYAGSLTVSVIADPGIVAEQDALAEALHTAFGRLNSLPRAEPDCSTMTRGEQNMGSGS